LIKDILVFVTKKNLVFKRKEEVSLIQDASFSFHLEGKKAKIY